MGRRSVREGLRTGFWVGFWGFIPLGAPAFVCQGEAVKSPAKRPHVVIIGGGFGGLEAAKGLGKAPVDVTLVDRNNHHLFQPLLYQVASAGLSPADIAIPIRTVLSRFSNIRVMMGNVLDMDLSNRHVTLEDGQTLHWDYLLVAAGAKSHYFGNDHWAKHSVGLKSIEDAVAIRRRVLWCFERAEREPDPAVRRRLLTFVVIGAGPTGVELAGALSELSRRVLARDYRTVHAEDTRVVLVERDPRVLPPFHPSLSENAQRELDDLHVEVRTNTAVVDVTQGRVELDGDVLETDTVLWTAGVAPVELAQKVGTPLERGRLRVREDCTLPGHDRVFAVGDIAHQMGPDGPLPGVSPVAMQQGRYVAKIIAQDVARPGAQRPPFRYFDKGMMATVGRSRAVLDIHGVRMTGFFAWIGWLVVHLFYLVGFKNRVSVLFNWIWQYATYRRGARLITHLDKLDPEPPRPPELAPEGEPSATERASA